MKKVNKLLVAGICWVYLVAAQSVNNSSQIPVNADKASTPPPVQNPPVAPQQGPPINKVMLRAQTDSMDSKRRTAPAPSQKVYTDSTRYIIHQGDTETAPKPKRQ
jgi:hypothetical protein